METRKNPAPQPKMVGIRLRTDNHKHYGQDIVVSMHLEDGREVELIRSFGALPDITIDHFITEIGIACCTSATATEDGR